MAAPADAPRALDRLLLPVVKIKAASSVRQLEQRLNYLWSSAHALLAASPALAHSMASTIMETARQHRVQLPAAVLDYLCQRCGALLVPSVSADARVLPQHHKTPANRKLARVQRRLRASGAAPQLRPELLQNVLQLTCRRCGFANVRHGASVVVKPKEKKKRSLEDTPNTPSQPQLKRPKKAEAEEATATKEKASEEPKPTPPAMAAPPERSVFAKPASPPRLLLDAKKKKKKPSAKDAAASAQVKSSLDSFLQNLRK